MTKKEIQVLNWVNRMRAKHFELLPLESLPKGKPMRSSSCPIGIAFQFRCVTRNNVYDTLTAESPLFAIPKYVREWMKRFDQGDYPEYINYKVNTRNGL